MICILLFRLIDPQTQVTRLRVGRPLSLWLNGFTSQKGFWLFIFQSSLLSCSVLHLSPAVVPSLQCGSVFVPPGQQEAVWFRSAPGGRAGWQPSSLLHLRVQQWWREGCLSVHPFALLSNTNSFICVTRPCSSCVSDLWQYRTGQTDSLPLWDGETHLELPTVMLELMLMLSPSRFCDVMWCCCGG